MSEAPDDGKRCPECKSTNLKYLGTREIRNPKAGPGAPILARTINVQCRRCKAEWSITRRATG